jgi:hypothetical protein
MVTQLSRAERRRRAREGAASPSRTAKPAPPGTVMPDAPKSRRRRFRPVWWLVGLAVLAVVIGGVWWAFSMRTAGQGTAGVGEQLANEGNTHVDPGKPIQYRAQPPASGNHYPRPAPPGVYPQGILPGYWVHSLEHGYIVLAYRPPVSPEMIAQFEGMVRDFPRSKYGFAKLVVVPYAEMSHPYAVLAWTWRLWLDQFDRQKILAFYRAHVDHAPEDVP